MQIEPETEMLYPLLGRLIDSYQEYSGTKTVGNNSILILLARGVSSRRANRIQNAFANPGVPVFAAAGRKGSAKDKTPITSSPL